MNTRIAFVLATMAGCGLIFYGADSARAEFNPPRTAQTQTQYNYAPTGGNYYAGSGAPIRYRAYRPSYNVYRQPVYPDFQGAHQYDSDWRFVANLYREILRREGSPAEIQTWVDSMARGQSRRRVEQGFLTSHEYHHLQRFGRFSPPIETIFEF